ncbi:substrate-binding domain-containing protein [Bradyrhizobium sp.]|uniref:substrate-binding domain-containing protein n=1 Tax=Bradyrhizobium sp. TaxID=376 RepID=UPI0025C2D446|nr:substrate-binding domain-containing protein [Bradyrhizobium sp.]
MYRTPKSHIRNVALAALTLLSALHTPLPAQPGPKTEASVVHVYGPGGPLPAMKEAAAQFSAKAGVQVEVVGGPTAKWIEEAKSRGDLIYSGSETMMTDFVTALGDRVNPVEVRPLYLRPSAILVRPGNPQRIKGFKDLLAPGRRILVVNGAGQNGLWEDMAGRSGDIGMVRTLRSNIKVFAATSAEAKQAWTDDPTLDAWIIWNIWQVANPTLADVVEVEPEFRIYRDTGIVLTRRGKDNPQVEAFARYLASSEGAAVFRKWGWSTPSN